MSVNTKKSPQKPTFCLCAWDFEAFVLDSSRIDPRWMNAVVCVYIYVSMYTYIHGTKEGGCDLIHVCVIDVYIHDKCMHAWSVYVYMINICIRVNVYIHE